jgi:hypothetical protein
MIVNTWFIDKDRFQINDEYLLLSSINISINEKFMQARLNHSLHQSAIISSDRLWKMN